MRQPETWTDHIGLGHAVVDMTGDDEHDRTVAVAAIGAEVSAYLAAHGVAEPATHERVKRLPETVTRTRIRWNARAVYSETLSPLRGT